MRRGWVGALALCVLVLGACSGGEIAEEVIENQEGVQDVDIDDVIDGREQQNANAVADVGRRLGPRQGLRLCREVVTFRRAGSRCVFQKQCDAPLGAAVSRKERLTLCLAPCGPPRADIPIGLRGLEP